LGSVRLFKDKIDEKDRMIDEKDRMIDEKDRMVDEKDKRIAEKDEAIRRLEETADIATALRETRRAETGRKWGKRAFCIRALYIQSLSRFRYPFAGLEMPTRHWARRRECDNPGTAAPTQKHPRVKALSVEGENLD
jgi:hypothetical protein